jgi:ABC-type glutathione transport system ATPase component
MFNSRKSSMAVLLRNLRQSADFTSHPTTSNGPDNCDSGTEQTSIDTNTGLKRKRDSKNVVDATQQTSLAAESLPSSIDSANENQSLTRIEVAILIGSSGSGKTTFAKSVLPSFAYVNKSALRKRKNFSAKWKEEQLVRQFVAQRRSVVVDADHLRSESRRSLSAAVRDAAQQANVIANITAYVFYKHPKVISNTRIQK